MSTIFKGLFVRSAILVVSALSVCEASRADNVHLETQDILMVSNDYLAMVRDYWPRIRTGDAQAMTLVYEALNNCGHFKDAIEEADDVDTLEGLLADRHPKDINFAKGMYFKCKGLVEHYDEFPDWQRLRLRAAQSGDSRSRVFIAFAYYYDRDKSPRDEVPFSPGEYLTGAMLEGDPLVFGMIAHAEPALRLRNDSSPLTTVAWGLLECRYRGDCDQPSSLRVHCFLMMPACLEAETATEFWRQRAGSDEDYEEAQRRAVRLLARIEQRRFDELDLDLIW